VKALVELCDEPREGGIGLFHGGNAVQHNPVKPPERLQNTPACSHRPSFARGAQACFRGSDTCPLKHTGQGGIAHLYLLVFRQQFPKVAYAGFPCRQ
jgi:hypothetical protein